MGTLRIRLQDLIYARHGKSSVLLACRRQNNIAYNIKCNVKSFRFVIPKIPHFKAALQNALHIKKTAVHCITSCRHIMNINISITTCLNFLSCHEKFLIEFFIYFIKDQASFGRNQCTVCVAVFLITNIHDRLALLVNFV